MIRLLYEAMGVAKTRFSVCPSPRRIACYLEEIYPDCLSLFGGPGGRAHTRFIHDWAEYALHYGGLVSLILPDPLDTLHPDDRTYFHLTRKATYGMTLEAS